MVEGAKLMVCSACQRLGKPYDEEPPATPTPSRAITFPRVISKKAHELPKGMEELDIAEDYAVRVRRERMKMGLTQGELAQRVKEKLSVIQKIETGRITPDTRLCRALEHELRIKLLVPRKEATEVPMIGTPAGVTLGEIVKIKSRSKTDLQI